MRSFLLAIFTFLLILPDLAGQDWIVPDDKKGKLSTFPFDDNTRTTGEKIYSVNCMSCHGTPGKANFLNLVPPPGDPASEKIQKNNDGEIFYKVTIGRGQMPSFRSILSSGEIWNVISFIRSFNNSYKQQIMPIITSSAYPGAVIKITLEYSNTDSTIVLNAIAANESSIVPVAGAEVKLFVQRTFGHLMIDEEKVTNSEGVARFRIPTRMPGDTIGNIIVSARFTNEEQFGAVTSDTILKAADITTPVSLIANRAMWNNVRKAPVWIILTYGLGLLTAWGFIFFVLMKLRDIFIVGKSVTAGLHKKED